MNQPPPAKEGDEADAEVAKNQKRTTSRRDLARNPKFEQVSPEVGELNEDAIDQGLRDDPDETLALLADLVGATDQQLRELARRLAGKLFLDVARRGGATAGRRTQVPSCGQGAARRSAARLGTKRTGRT